MENKELLFVHAKTSKARLSENLGLSLRFWIKVKSGISVLPCINQGPGKKQKYTQKRPMKDNLMKGLCTKLGAELRKIGRADEGLGSGSFKKVSPMSSWAKDRGSRMRTGQKLSV